MPSTLNYNRIERILSWLSTISLLQLFSASANLLRENLDSKLNFSMKNLSNTVSFVRIFQYQHF